MNVDHENNGQRFQVDCIKADLKVDLMTNSEVLQQAQHQKIETDKSDEKKKTAFIPEMKSANLYYKRYQYNI
jgi:hypothetical protein